MVVVVVTAVTVTAVSGLIEVLLLICLKSMQVYFLLLLPVDSGYFGDLSGNICCMIGLVVVVVVVWSAF